MWWCGQKWRDMPECDVKKDEKIFTQMLIYITMQYVKSKRMASKASQLLTYVWKCVRFAFSKSVIRFYLCMYSQHKTFCMIMWEPVNQMSACVSFIICSHTLSLFIWLESIQFNRWHQFKMAWAKTVTGKIYQNEYWAWNSWYEFYHEKLFILTPPNDTCEMPFYLIFFLLRTSFHKMSVCFYSIESLIHLMWLNNDFFWRPLKMRNVIVSVCL